MKNDIPEYKRAISYIDDKIKSHELIVGSKLPTERAIAEELGISRNSAREAFIVLDSMGIIERVQGSGSYISTSAYQTVSQIVDMSFELGRISENDLLEFRRVIERSICILLVDKGVSESDIQELERIVADMDTDDAEIRAESDIQFHNKLISLANNPLLCTMSQVVNIEFQKNIKGILGKSDANLKMKLLEAHRDIIASIVSKDKHAVVKSVEEHFNLAGSVL